ncbi:MAG TPA: prolyl aminopeptidase [Candidatus Cybelea sp.]|nr:prolyl aminopeptidase [Candidatus Cybelea sp.]
MASKDLYPEIEPYDTGMLPLTGPSGKGFHQMYYEQSGNPKGVPVVFLHGGPGAGANATHRRFFDPSHYRIVVFDQRGAGRSKPLGEIRDNTTPLLIEDIEALRVHLGIDSWFVFGGSWGSTLAIAYAEFHPERVRGLALRGIFLCRKSEIDWFLYGLRELAPEAWRAFAGHIPEPERGDLLKAYYKRLMDPDPQTHMPAARAWSVYEGSCSTLLPSPETVRAFAGDVLALGLSRMEAHYFQNNIFLPESYLLANIHKIRHLPTVMVQGRYDLVCPIRTADELHLAWPEASYFVVPDAGHSAMEPGIRSALVTAMDRFRDLG